MAELTDNQIFCQTFEHYFKVETIALNNAAYTIALPVGLVLESVQLLTGDGTLVNNGTISGNIASFGTVNPGCYNVKFCFKVLSAIDVLCPSYIGVIANWDNCTGPTTLPSFSINCEQAVDCCTEVFSGIAVDIYNATAAEIATAVGTTSIDDGDHIVFFDTDGNTSVYTYDLDNNVWVTNSSCCETITVSTNTDDTNPNTNGEVTDATEGDTYVSTTGAHWVYDSTTSTWYSECAKIVTTKTYRHILEWDGTTLSWVSPAITANETFVLDQNGAIFVEFNANGDDQFYGLSKYGFSIVNNANQTFTLTPTETWGEVDDLCKIKIIYQTTKNCC